MEDQVIGRVYDIQRFTIHDGPGIRTDVFLTGCPLSCLWCHSPESQRQTPQLAWFAVRCIGVKDCGLCVAACPKGAVLPEKKTGNTDKALITVDRAQCVLCGKCAEICPAQALCLTGSDMSAAQVMEIIKKDMAYYKKTGGGVTVSGGEPMVQHEFTEALLKSCKRIGLNTCLDTTGFAPWELYRKVLPYVDLVLYDLKHMDANKSKEYTGVTNELILENAGKMAALGLAMQIRVPIIPGYNDNEKNLRATGEFCKKLGSAVRIVQILPYHRLGVVKYERIGKVYPMADINPPSEEHLQSCKELLESYGLAVRIH